MLAPKKIKHRKQHRGRMRGMAKGGTEVHFGDYGLKALEAAWITNRQIEAARVAMTRYMKRGGKVFINIYPAMLGADGQPRRELFVADMLHLNADGYAVWRPLVAPFLE